MPYLYLPQDVFLWTSETAQQKQNIVLFKTTALNLLVKCHCSIPNANSTFQFVNTSSNTSHKNRILFNCTSNIPNFFRQTLCRLSWIKIPLKNNIICLYPFYIITIILFLLEFEGVSPSNNFARIFYLFFLESKRIF